MYATEVEFPSPMGFFFISISREELIKDSKTELFPSPMGIFFVSMILIIS